ncbi:MAG: hypothetical protein JW814_11820 [Candidatus Krumholzibacteriota bacterium]|nr:hypothetical protein [Candidatus Krumholzibacteriota bacterium]
MNKFFILCASFLMMVSLMNSCSDTTISPDGDTETLLNANFREADLEDSGFLTSNFSYSISDGKVMLQPYDTYAYMESLEQWEVTPGYLYRLTIQLETEECDDGPGFDQTNYCGLLCNDLYPVWIVTENQEYLTRSSFVNGIDGWTCFSDEFCPRYETYVFEITQNSVVGFVIVDNDHVEFVDCGETNTGTVESIRISIRMESSGGVGLGSNPVLKIRKIILQKVTLEDN